MTITRYLNGKEISKEELYKLELTNPTLELLCAAVRKRLSESSEKQEAEAPASAS